LVGVLAALMVSSCSVVDDFSGRAVNFNLVAEQAQQQALLLNIVRASLNRPMQFTTLSSITGTASETANGTMSVPFGHHRPTSGVSPDILGLSGTVSGGPTFTVPVLDTQEFYQGELKPLTGQEYRFFLDEGLWPAELFYIFVDHIEMTVADERSASKFEFHNYIAGDYFDYDRFAAVADYLLSLGLTIEEVRRPQTLGPPITAAQLRDLRDVAQLTTAGISIVPERSAEKTAPAQTVAPAAEKAKKSASPKTTGRYQLQKSTVIYRPCFEPVSPPLGVIDPSLLCGSNDPNDTSDGSTGNLGRTGGFTAPGLAHLLTTIKARYVAGLPAGDPTTAEIAALPALPGDKKLQVRLYMRSTEAIMHHLGTIAGRYLYQTGSRQRVMQVKIGEPYLPYPAEPCPPTADPTSQPTLLGFQCQNLFVLRSGDAGDSPLSVDYDGKTFSVVSGNTRGRTMQLLDLVKQLFALHTSAQQLPASNVLNIIGGPAQ
jgi:hypothetical protein